MDKRCKCFLQILPGAAVAAGAAVLVACTVATSDPHFVRGFVVADRIVWSNESIEAKLANTKWLGTLRSRQPNEIATLPESNVTVQTIQ
eukprot:301700-Amphidinium_carterae.1